MSATCYSSTRSTRSGDTCHPRAAAATTTTATRRVRDPVAEATNGGNTWRSSDLSWRPRRALISPTTAAFLHPRFPFRTKLRRRALRLVAAAATVARRAAGCAEGAGGPSPRRLSPRPSATTRGRRCDFTRGGPPGSPLARRGGRPDPETAGRERNRRRMRPRGHRNRRAGRSACCLRSWSWSSRARAGGAVFAF